MNNSGYIYYDWNITSGDASYPPPDKEDIIDNVLEGAKKQDNAVILFHDGSSQHTTVEALPEIIEELKELGFNFDVLTKDGYRAQFLR